MVHVHGHYQCPFCHTNAQPCCDGDNCDTNYFFREQGINDQKNTPPISPDKKKKIIE
jgi:hypothetical protein